MHRRAGGSPFLLKRLELSYIFAYYLDVITYLSDKYEFVWPDSGVFVLALNRLSLHVGSFSPAVPSLMQDETHPVRVLQIGDGNFLRAFAGYLIDLANAAGVFNAKVTIVPPRSRGCVEALLAQDCLYTVLTRGVQNGHSVDAARIISCVDQALHPASQWRELKTLAQDPNLRFVVSNTTEAGIVYVPEVFADDRCPETFPAKLTALLWARFQHFGAEADRAWVVFPCELIEANGDKLKEFVLQHAKDWALPEAFLAWVQVSNHFCNTLVDRIVPGFPAEEAEAIFAKLGYADPLLVTAEPFLQWVIEGPAHLAEEFPVHKVSHGVIWTDDLASYRRRKVRILNGLHTSCALAAYGAGLETVLEMLEDRVLLAFMQTILHEEILEFVPQADAERSAYAASILERFRNPYIRHELLSISLNSVSKWQVRVLPSLKDFVAKHGSIPKGLAFSLAALLHFYHGHFEPGGQFLAEGAFGPYEVRDHPSVLQRMDEAWRAWGLDGNGDRFVTRLLADTHLWGEDLTQMEGFSAYVSRCLMRIQIQGMRSAIQAVFVEE